MNNHRILPTVKALAAAGLLFALSFLVSCAQANVEEEALKNAVAKYNYSIILAYKSSVFQPLEAVASEEEVRKVRVYIRAFRTAGELMEAEYTAMVFKEIAVNGDSATVRTSEDWSYKWIYISTGRELEPVKKKHYEMLYTMKKRGGNWIVDKLEEIKDK